MTLQEQYGGIHGAVDRVPPDCVHVAGKRLTLLAKRHGVDALPFIRSWVRHPRFGTRPAFDGVVVRRRDAHAFLFAWQFGTGRISSISTKSDRAKLDAVVRAMLAGRDLTDEEKAWRFQLAAKALPERAVWLGSWLDLL